MTLAAERGDGKAMFPSSRFESRQGSRCRLARGAIKPRSDADRHSRHARRQPCSGLAGLRDPTAWMGLRLGIGRSVRPCHKRFTMFLGFGPARFEQAEGTGAKPLRRWSAVRWPNRGNSLDCRLAVRSRRAREYLLHRRLTMTSRPLIAVKKPYPLQCRGLLCGHDSVRCLARTGPVPGVRQTRQCQGARKPVCGYRLDARLRKTYFSRNICATRARSRFAGTVCEVGPGGDLGLMLMMLMHGARQADAVERFDTLRPGDEQLEIYNRIAAQYASPLGR